VRIKDLAMCMSSVTDLRLFLVLDPMEKAPHF
jgi:hypothetical protein